MKTPSYLPVVLFTAILLNISCNKENEQHDCSEFNVDVSTNTTYAIAEATNGVEPVSYTWSNGETGATIGSPNGNLTNGTYTVTANDARGCEAQASITINKSLDEEIVISSKLTCVREHTAFLTMGIYDGEGNYYSHPDYPIIDKGFCYSLNTQPSVFNNVSKTITYGEYELSPLQMGTSYFARAYVITTKDTVYGQEHSFTTNSSPPPYTIGQNYQGGIISYLSCDGLHGTIVLAQDYVSFGMNHDNAKHQCENLTLLGFSDWTLPSGEDLYFMDKNLYQQGLGNFHTGNTIYDAYWSSFKRYDADECGDHVSLYRNFQQGSTAELSVCYKLRFRPVRYF